MQRGATLRVVTLGPAGTFSQQAVEKIFPGSEVEFCKTIKDVFIEVESNEGQKGVVPVENSLGGGVNFTLDALQDHDLMIEAEEIIPIIHCLMGPNPYCHPELDSGSTEIPDQVRNDKLSKIKSLYLHPQTYAQCEEFIHKYLPEAEIVETFSNADSAEKVMNNGGTSACIAPAIAADIYNLKIFKKGVQDNQFNVTRFFVISKSSSRPSGYDKTSITVYPQIDRPGLLHEILSVFKNNEINLTKIESRPSKGRLGDYIFYIDLEGHINDNNLKKAIAELENDCFVKILGSYPRKY